MIDCIHLVMCLHIKSWEGKCIWTLSLQTLALAVWVVLALESNVLKMCLSSQWKRMSKESKIYSSSTHNEGLTWSWSSHLQRLIVCWFGKHCFRDKVCSWSKPVEGRHDIFYFEDVNNEAVLQMYNSHTTVVLSLLLLCITVHQNCLVICVPWRKQPTLLLNVGGDNWSLWNDRVNENNDMIVVQEHN